MNRNQVGSVLLSVPPVGDFSSLKHKVIKLRTIYYVIDDNIILSYGVHATLSWQLSNSELLTESLVLHASYLLGSCSNDTSVSIAIRAVINRVRQ